MKTQTTNITLYCMNTILSDFRNSTCQKHYWFHCLNMVHFLVHLQNSSKSTHTNTSLLYVKGWSLWQTWGVVSINGQCMGITTYCSTPYRQIHPLMCKVHCIRWHRHLNCTCLLHDILWLHNQIKETASLKKTIPSDQKMCFLTQHSKRNFLPKVPRFSQCSQRSRSEYEHSTSQSVKSLVSSDPVP